MNRFTLPFIFIFVLAGCGAVAPGTFQANQAKTDSSGSLTGDKQDDGTSGNAVTNPDSGASTSGASVSGSPDRHTEVSPSPPPTSPPPVSATPVPTPAAPMTGTGGGSSSGGSDAGPPVAAVGDPKSAPPASEPATFCHETKLVDSTKEASLFYPDDETMPLSKDESKPTPVPLSPKWTFGGSYLVKAYVTSMISTSPAKPGGPDPVAPKPTEYVWGYVRILATSPSGKTVYHDVEISDVAMEIIPVYPKGKKVLRYNLTIDDSLVDSGSTIRMYYYHARSIGHLGMSAEGGVICIGAHLPPPDPSDDFKPYTDPIRKNFEAPDIAKDTNFLAVLLAK